MNNINTFLDQNITNNSQQSNTNNLIDINGEKILIQQHDILLSNVINMIINDQINFYNLLTNDMVKKSLNTNDTKHLYNIITEIFKIYN